MEGKGTQIWTLSGDVNEYERIKNLLNGRLSNSFSREHINAHTLARSLEHLQAKSHLDVIHEGSDIGKPYSKALPHLTGAYSTNSRSSSLTQILDCFIWKNKVYQQASLSTTYGKLCLRGHTYQVCRIEVSDRKGVPIFKEPMLLLTNAPVENHLQAFQIYRRYLSSKIEGVFGPYETKSSATFLKDHLGWEKFQIGDFLAIQNIIVLCFFVAEYFYENQPQLCQHTQVTMICQLANSKGKVSKHFYLEGLAIMANYLLFQQYIKEQNLSQQQVDQLLSILK